jgi:hypothetical protein
MTAISIILTVWLYAGIALTVYVAVHGCVFGSNEPAQPHYMEWP